MKSNSLLLLLTLSGCCTPRQASTERTVTVHDTLITRVGVQRDTVVKTLPQDTVFLQRDRLRVRVARSHDTLRISGTCAPDTLRIPIVHETIRTVLSPPKAPDRWPYILAALAGAAALLGLLRLLKAVF